MLERASIRPDLGYLRKALSNPNAYVSCGGGGTILHLGLTTVSLYAPVERFPLATMAVQLGAPLVDKRHFDDVIAPERWLTLSQVPLITYLDAAERLGARIANDLRVDRATYPTKCPNACIHARHLPAWQKAEADAKALLKEKRLSVIQQESLKSERARIRDVIGQVSTES
jgi:hypothetical protein